MSRITMPSREEVLALAEVRSDICVSLYLETSPLKLNAGSCRIDLSNLARQAVDELKQAGHPKRRIWPIEEHLAVLTEDEEFCREQVNSLAVFVTPESLRTFKLANTLPHQMEVSDRFYLKPLFRALTFRHTAFVLALSENRARVIELHPDTDPHELKVADMPKDAPSALGLSSLSAALGGPLERKDDRKNRLARYSRKVDAALRKITNGCEYPVVLAATEPLASIYPSVASVCLAQEGIHANPEEMSAKELEARARPILDSFYAHDLARFKALFEERAGQNRVATDLTDVARAATYGAVSLALVDFERIVTGYISEDGVLTLSSDSEAYGVIDEIVKRCLENDGRVIAVRAEDMIGNTGVAAVLRYPLYS